MIGRSRLLAVTESSNIDGNHALHFRYSASVCLWNFRPTPAIPYQPRRPCPESGHLALCFYTGEAGIALSVNTFLVICAWTAGIKTESCSVHTAKGSPKPGLVAKEKVIFPVSRYNLFRMCVIVLENP